MADRVLVRTLREWSRLLRRAGTTRCRRTVLVSRELGRLMYESRLETLGHVYVLESAWERFSGEDTTATRASTKEWVRRGAYTPATDCVRGE